MLRDVLEVYDWLESPSVSGETVVGRFDYEGMSAESTTVETDAGSTDFVTLRITGRVADAPTLGVVGQLGGLGARPDEFGTVSDADGAIAALAAARYLARHTGTADHLPGSVVITTHICPDAPTKPHDPVPFMSSPIDTETANAHQVMDEMDAILSIDTTKGNRIHCNRGFAISPTIKQGWILRVSEDLLGIQERVTGQAPETLTTTMQDITPYGNGVHHINSLFQPSTATNAPLVGIATTSETPVAGSATGANYLTEIAEAATFIVETAKEYTRGRADFYSQEEFEQLNGEYGPMTQLQG